MWKSAGRATFLRVSPRHLPFNWEKSTENLSQDKKNLSQDKENLSQVNKNLSQYNHLYTTITFKYLESSFQTG
jgi:hypothetical protein